MVGSSANKKNISLIDLVFHFSKMWGDDECIFEKLVLEPWMKLDWGVTKEETIVKSGYNVKVI